MPDEPLVLLANADEWLTQSLESVLTQGGYRVMSTIKRQQVLELARRHQPDAILLDMGLDQRVSDNLALCRALRADLTLPRATPITLTTGGAREIVRSARNARHSARLSLTRWSRPMSS